MMDENLYDAQPQFTPLEEMNLGESVLPQDIMDARLTDPDRRAVDFLLDGDESPLENASPMARNAFMDRVQAVRRVLSLLNSLPTEQPSSRLLETTMAHMPGAGESDSDAPAQPGV